MARLVKLGGWSGAGGTAVLSAFSHTMPLLICAMAGLVVLGMLFLAWVISNDRRVKHLNLLLRGEPLPPDPDEQVSIANLGQASSAEPDGAELAESRPDSLSAGQGAGAYIALLRNSGYSELADAVERALATDNGKGEDVPTPQISAERCI